MIYKMGYLPDHVLWWWLPWMMSASGHRQPNTSEMRGGETGADPNLCTAEDHETSEKPGENHPWRSLVINHYEVPRKNIPITHHRVSMKCIWVGIAYLGDKFKSPFSRRGKVSEEKDRISGCDVHGCTSVYAYYICESYVYVYRQQNISKHVSNESISSPTYPYKS